MHISKHSYVHRKLIPFYIERVLSPRWILCDMLCTVCSQGSVHVFAILPEGEGVRGTLRCEGPHLASKPHLFQTAEYVNVRKIISERCA